MFLITCGFLLVSWRLAAGVADDLARIHVESLGGVERLARLQALRAEGRTRVQGQEVRFVLWAARPNAVRVETTAGERVRRQGWDGSEAAPWQQAVVAGVPKPAGALDEFEARELRADAEFDDPLVDSARRGYAVDFAGEMTLDGRAVFKLLVTRHFTEQFTLYLDAETYLIVRRDSTRRFPGGRDAQLVTHYRDFRSVAGVLLPHRVAVEADGKALHETVLELVEANPRLAPGFFRAPGS
ncbi:MAG TPA: hypothetical protein VGD81_01940 [Opitutaceae bacterium]